MSFTTVKKIGSGQVYTTLAAWNSGAPANLTTAVRWNATTFVGTFTQGEVVNGLGSLVGKFLDADGSSTIDFGVTSGTPTAGTLTGASSGATCVITTNNATGCVWQGQINSASDNFSAPGSNILTVSGSTNSSSAYKELNAATGASFRDNVNVQTNALKYNTANGCSISSGGGYVDNVVVSEGNFHSSGVQYNNSSANTHSSAFVMGGGGTSGFIIDGCIFDAETQGGGYALYTASDCVVSNCLFVNRGSSISHSGIVRGDTGTNLNFVNCTFVAPSNVTNKPTVGIVGSYSTINVKNCAVFGASAVTTTSANAIFNITTSYTDNTKAGWTTINYDTTTGSGFQGITLAAADFRIKSSSGLIDVATTYSAPPPTADIARSTRPQGASFDVGCWEYVSGGGPTFAAHRMFLTG